MITIVSSDNCPYCVAAKQLLDSLGYEYNEKKIDMWSSDLRDVIDVTWMMTVPQIFSGEITRENLIWGYTELTQLQADWRLEEVLK